MIKKIIFYVATILFSMSIISCAGFKAERMSDKDIDKKAMEITDEWVDGDTIRVIEKVVSKIYDHRRFQKYRAKRNGKDIKLFVGFISNNTSEAYFPVQDLTDALLEKLSNSDVFVLIDAQKRESLLKEITYQNDGMVDPAQAKTIGKQSGADLMLFGDINMKPHRRKGKTVKTYTVNLRLTDIESGEEKVRVREKINKFSKQSRW